MYMNVLPVYMPWKPEDGIRPPGIRVRDGCKLPCGYMELNFRPLKEQLLGL